MVETILKYLKQIGDFFVQVDKELGFKKFLKYITIILVILGVFNFKTITKNIIEFHQEIAEQIHNEKMAKRDQLLAELIPVLKEFRASVNADRVLYFEYHNSKENLVGIPFKYVDLVLQDSKYGIARIPESSFRDINVGAIAPLYEDIKYGSIVFNQDSTFIEKYPGAADLFCISDKQAYLSIPGISQPIGLIVFEWEEQHDINSYDLENISGIMISRINALIMSKR